MGFQFEIIKDLTLNEVCLLKSDQFSDHRGSIWTTYRDNDFKRLGLPVFTHDKCAVSKYQVLRGIHGDFKSWKLVSCLHGAVEQVVVDCRAGSPSFKRWTKYELQGGDGNAVLIPPGFGNAFLVTSDCGAVYNYKLSYDGQYNDAEEQFTYPWNDSSIGINWSINNPKLSLRDKGE